jgi:hypothetical protein
LYNVADATRPVLQEKLENRTLLFGETPRFPDALQAFKDHIRTLEEASPLEEEIHVCEFSGFLDGGNRVVGCMLHPTAPGNKGVDLRGMCHYGSMACRSFFCPAWEEIAVQRLRLIVNAVQDWHLYGLVITDADFVSAIFGLLEYSLGEPLEPHALRCSEAWDVFREMLSWKDSWPFKETSTLRRNRYYFKGAAQERRKKRDSYMADLMEILRFTFDLQEVTADWQAHVNLTVERFVQVYR